MQKYGTPVKELQNVVDDDETDIAQDSSGYACLPDYESAIADFETPYDPVCEL